MACGAVQAACYLAVAYLFGGIVVTSYGVIAAATGPFDTYLRAVGLVAAIFGVTSLLPVAAKWLLVGRWKPGVIALWSPAYLRFWAVRQLARATPMRLFVGTSLYLATCGRSGPGSARVTSASSGEAPAGLHRRGLDRAGAIVRSSPR